MTKRIEIADQATWSTKGMQAIDAMLKGNDRELVTPKGLYFVFDEDTDDFNIALRTDGMETSYRYQEGNVRNPISLYLATTSLEQHGGGRRRFIDFLHVIDTKRHVGYNIELGRSALQKVTIEPLDASQLEEITPTSRFRELIRDNF